MILNFEKTVTVRDGIQCVIEEGMAVMTPDLIMTIERISRDGSSKRILLSGKLLYMPDMQPVTPNAYAKNIRIDNVIDVYDRGISRIERIRDTYTLDIRDRDGNNYNDDL